MDWMLLFSILPPAMALVFSLLNPTILKRWLVALDASTFWALMLPVVVFGIVGLWQLAIFIAAPGSEGILVSGMIFYLSFSSFGFGMAIARFRLKRELSKKS